jgi:hypothetical protein
MLKKWVEQPMCLESVQGNLCPPFGTHALFPLSPCTSVTGFPMPPLRGWGLVDLVFQFSPRFSSHVPLKASGKKKALIAALAGKRPLYFASAQAAVGYGSVAPPRSELKVPS